MCGDPGHLVQDFPHPYRAVLAPKFSSDYTKPSKPIAHFAENPPVATEIPKVYESDSHEKGDESVPECKETDDDKTEQEMYKIRAEYYTTRENTIRMVSTSINYEAEIVKNINGHTVARDSQVILIDIGASRSVCGRKWVDWRFESSSWCWPIVKSRFDLDLAHPCKVWGRRQFLFTCVQKPPIKWVR